MKKIHTKSKQAYCQVSPHFTTMPFDPSTPLHLQGKFPQ